jgi:hypothetical protein
VRGGGGKRVGRGCFCGGLQEGRAAWWLLKAWSAGITALGITLGGSILNSVSVFLSWTLLPSVMVAAAAAASDQPCSCPSARGPAVVIRCFRSPDLCTWLWWGCRDGGRSGGRSIEEEEIDGRENENGGGPGEVGGRGE